MKTTVSDHIAKAEDSLEAARYLILEEYVEAAVNRAYYAMFDTTRTLLFVKDIFAKTHKGVHAKFHELYIKEGHLPASLGTILSQTEDMREKGDYEFEQILTLSDAQKAIEDATYFLEQAKQYLTAHQLLND